MILPILIPAYHLTCDLFTLRNNLGKPGRYYLGFHTRRWVSVLAILCRVVLQEYSNWAKRVWRRRRRWILMLVDRFINGRSFMSRRTRVEKCHRRYPHGLSPPSPRIPSGGVAVIVFPFSLEGKRTRRLGSNASRTFMDPLLLP